MLKLCSPTSNATALILESLCISSLERTALSDTFLSGGAPRLRSLFLNNVTCPLFPTPHLTHLNLDLFEHRGDTFFLDKSIKHLQITPCLEYLCIIQIGHRSEPRTSRDYQLRHSAGPITLPALSSLEFTGPGPNLDVLLRTIQAPHLMTFRLAHLQSDFPPSLVHFLCGLQRLKPDAASVELGPSKWALYASVGRSVFPKNQGVIIETIFATKPYSIPFATHSRPRSQP
ncbi:hypothetical protein BC834DRAFT_166719 [Gloeopeniophorella convolvens]|nr:hypothetical protein BC834DRAFT_166719 [Gloeopeniophorella convolvens]